MAISSIAEPGTVRRRPRAWALGVCRLTLIVHSPAAWNGFTNWDDPAYVTTSPLVKSPAGLPRIWASDESPQYYPLTFTTYWVEYRLWGHNPCGYHVVNIFL